MRKFLFGSIAAAGLSVSLSTTASLSANLRAKQTANKFPFACPDLPYPHDALAPLGISAETLRFHHDKHHASYVEKLNALLKAKPELQTSSLEDLVRSQRGVIYNNAAQAWNHSFYWQSMSPKGGGEPSGPLASQIEQQWGSFEAFKREFTQRAAGAFGSGWLWLAQNPKSGGLEIIEGHDADSPLTIGLKPIITCDLWEHAYYIDYRNERAKYIAAWWSTVNWEFAARNFNQ